MVAVTKTPAEYLSVEMGQFCFTGGGLCLRRGGQMCPTRVKLFRIW